jgi:UDP-GlcNAc3NAcA epimerase
MSLKILTIIGARPQIIKAAALSRAIRNSFQGRITEVIVHTGQHYDSSMSQVFFDELEIPAPDYNLNVGSGSHGKQTAAMIVGIEEILVKEKPACIVLYGDTNSTLAGGIAASKIHVPVVHIEAGLRSFNKKMPEEVNRIMCDHVSTLLFSPTRTGFRNLEAEGFDKDATPPYSSDNPKIYHCGDVMLDNSLYFAQVAEQKTSILADLGLEKGKFILATIHRDSNTDQPLRLNALFGALHRISSGNSIKIVLPLHPRTNKILQENLSPELYNHVASSPNILLLPPASFLEMIALEKNASMIITDSGGVQKEAFFFQKPCIILRSETEWTELVEQGTAIIADADEEKIIAAYSHFANNSKLTFKPVFGDGHAAEFICGEMLTNFGN